MRGNKLPAFLLFPLPVMALLLPMYHIVAAESPSPSPASTSRSAIVAFELMNNKIVIPCTVEQAAPMRMILDSGMGWDGLLVYNPDRRKQISLIDPVPMNVGGAGSGVAAGAMVSESMRVLIGDLVLERQTIAVLQNNDFEGFPSDGVIGFSLLGHYAVEIDHEERKLILHDPEKWNADASWTAIPIYFKEKNIPWVQIEVEVESQKPRKIQCYIDSASSETLEILLRNDQEFKIPRQAVQYSLGRGLSGEIIGKKAGIASVRIGPFTLYKPEAAFIPAEVRSKQKNADGVAGNGLLVRFEVIFDYPHKKLYLKPRPQASETMRNDAESDPA
jgi:hypothetical protein